MSGRYTFYWGHPDARLVDVTSIVTSNAVGGYFFLSATENWTLVLGDPVELVGKFFYVRDASTNAVLFEYAENSVDLRVEVA